MIRRLTTLAFALLAIFSTTSPAVSAAAPSPLRLVGTANGEEFHDFVVEKYELRVRRDDGSTASVPPEMRWRLEGDLQANADRILVRPDYEIVRRPVPNSSTADHTRAFGVVRIDRDRPWRKLHDSIIVFAWIVDGRATWIDVRPVSRDGGASADIAAITALELDAETEHGFPVALALRDGEFLEPLPTTRQIKLRRALADIHLGSTQDLENGLASLKSVNASVDSKGFGLLHQAGEAGNAAAVSALLAHGAKVNATDRDGRSALFFAARNGRLGAVRAILAGEVATRRAVKHKDEFAMAILNGHLAVALELLDDTDRKRGIRSSAVSDLLELAILQGNRATASALLAGNTNENWAKALSDDVGTAVEYGDPALTKILIEGGIKADLVVNGLPLLVMAASAANVESVEMLLQGGAVVDRADRDGTTPLMSAICSGDLATAELILRAGANPLAPDRDRRTAMERAMTMEREDLVALLQAHGASPVESVALTGTVRRSDSVGDSCCCPFLKLPIYGAADTDQLPVVMEGPEPFVGSYASHRDDYAHDVVFRDPRTGEHTTNSGGGMILGLRATTTRRLDYWAVVTFVVEPNGSVSSLRMVKAATREFSEAAAEVLQAYVFRPGSRNGQPVRTRFTLAITAPGR